MGRKKRNRLNIKPFCYYCEREFPDEKVLIQHQKARHFKCMECNRKLDTATGLVVHMIQVHKINISKVPHANVGRDNPEVTVHGMEGVPPEILAEKEEIQAQAKGIRMLKSAHTIINHGGLDMMGNMNGMPGQMPQNMNNQAGHPGPFDAPVMWHPHMGMGGHPPMMGGPMHVMGGAVPPRMAMSAGPFPHVQGLHGNMPNISNVSAGGMPTTPANVIDQMEKPQIEAVILAPTPPSGELIYHIENISPEESKIFNLQNTRRMISFA